jgi:hypothetical protein
MAWRTSKDVNVNTSTQPDVRLQMLLVPCSCGNSFAVSRDYDQHGAAWSRYLTCPHCGKKHDPRNRLLELGFQPEGYWRVDRC